MISISEKANSNYLAKIVKLKNLRKHDNADRLQVATIDFQTVITGLDAKDGDIYCFFPLECQINAEFLAFTNSFRHSELNADKKAVGFFGDKGRVRAVKLRGEKSMGYLVPVTTLDEFFKGKLNYHFSDYVDQEFDTINGMELLKKYQIRIKTKGLGGGKQAIKRISRLVDNQVRLHVSTDNLKKSVHMINPDDEIVITYKLHGTSWWVANLLTKRSLSIWEKTLRFLGVKIRDTEYDYIYGSRKVVKNEYETKKHDHFYKVDIWGEIKDELKEFIPKGFTLYGEAVGYTSQGGAIQGEYDYGCDSNKNKAFIYRIINTNEDGIVSELSSADIQEFCERFDLNYVPVLFQGKAKDFCGYENCNRDKDVWRRNFMEDLIKKYTEQDCHMCTNKVPAEGIVIRKDSMFKFEVYKLKSFAFLEKESKWLDEGKEDMESNN